MTVRHPQTALVFNTKDTGPPTPNRRSQGGIKVELFKPGTPGVGTFRRCDNVEYGGYIRSCDPVRGAAAHAETGPVGDQSDGEEGLEVDV